jgi:hypothetical protein
MIRKIISLAFFTLFLAASGKAQSATFTFGAISGPSGSIGSGNCASITAWNGDPNAYPYEMGDICFNFYPNGFSSIDAPFQLGFPNNGFLQECGPTTWGPQVFTQGNATTDGSIFTQTVTFSGCYDGGNTTVNATVNFVVHSKVSCGHGRCHTYYFNYVTGGSGTIENQ